MTARYDMTPFDKPIAQVIDAMDLLHSGRFDGFCLVSSVSDFTRLAARIREQGLDVYGFGEQKTPESFRRACKRFIYTENLLPQSNGPVTAGAEAGGNGAVGGSSKRPPTAAIPHIHTALSQLDDVDGWHFLGAVGTRLAALMPDFDPRTYGCPKLLTLIEKSDAFEVRRENLNVYIRRSRQVRQRQSSPAERPAASRPHKYFASSSSSSRLSCQTSLRSSARSE